MTQTRPVLELRQTGPPIVLAVQVAELYDAQVIDALQAELQSHLPEHAGQGWVLDFSRTRFLISRVLSVLIEHHRKVTAAGGKLVLCGLDGNLRRLFTLTRLDTVFPIADTLPAAQQLAGHA
jgi:anti-anti-sigma factor